MDNNYDSLLSSLLNLRNSDIQSIDVSTHDDGSTHYHVRLNRMIKECPICQQKDLRSLGYYRRKVTIPNDVFTGSVIDLEIPRYQCLSCHNTFSDSKHMAPANRTISYKTIIEVMNLLMDPKMTFKSVSKLVHISESSVVRIFDAHCHLTRQTFPEAICVDEVYTKNNDFKSKYACIFYDFYDHTIIDVAPDRKKNYLHHYFQSIPTEELSNVKYVCMDMYSPYKDISRLYFKKALICVDSFHVIKHLNEDLSKIRIRVMDKYPTDSKEYYLLKSWKYLLFDRDIDLDNKGKYNKRFKQFMNYRDLKTRMLAIDSDLAIGYKLKEMYMDFNSTCTLEEAPKMLDNIINSFSAAKLPEYSEFTGLLKSWRNEIINSFTYYNDRRINNSVAESVNAIVSALLFNTRGIRNHERRRKRMMYAVNKTGFNLK